MKNYKLILLLTFVSLSAFSQSQTDFCDSFTKNARTSSVNFKKSYFTNKDNTFIQIMYVSELAADSGQSYLTMSRESNNSDYVRTLTQKTLSSYRVYGLTSTLKSYGFTHFQLVLIYNENSKSYSTKYKID